MRLLIKGMKMPQSCGECWFRAGAWCAAIEDWRKAYNTPPKGERLEDCPLIELPPHGDLIDRDVLLGDRHLDTYNALFAVASAYAVIEAEGDGQ